MDGEVLGRSLAGRLLGVCSRPGGDLCWRCCGMQLVQTLLALLSFGGGTGCATQTPESWCPYKVLQNQGEEGRLCFRSTEPDFQCLPGSCKAHRSPGRALLANVLVNGSVLLQWLWPPPAPTPPAAPLHGFTLSCTWEGAYTRFQCASVRLGAACRDYLLADPHGSVPYRLCLRPIFGPNPGTDTRSRPGYDPGTDGRARPGYNPGTDAGSRPGYDPGTNARSRPGFDSGPETDTGFRPGYNPGTDTGSRPGYDPGPGTDARSRPGPDPGPGTDPTSSPGYDPGPGTDARSRPGPDPGPGTDPTSSPGYDPGPGTYSRPGPDSWPPECVEFTVEPAGMRDIVVAMTAVGGSICVMLVLICLLVAYLTENLTPPSRAKRGG